MNDRSKRTRKPSKSTRLDAALAIRELALVLLNDSGEWLEVPPHGRVRAYRTSELQMILHTPSQRLPGTRWDKGKMGAYPVVNLDYGLNIWDTRGKVMNLEWTVDGNFKLAALRRGEWEEHLQTLVDRGAEQ